jgi:hypothetical protein
MSNKLGLYYTNSTIPNIIDYTLKVLSDYQDIIDIRTCSWKPIKNNPFPEMLSITHSRSHLNIIIQILQLLYSVPTDYYKYVLFLEHDVIYPKEYFSFPDFEDNCLVNENYMGVCKDGFQDPAEIHQPMHQMVMRFSDAVKHFESIIYRSIKKDKTLCLEPECQRYVWRCSKPPIHINHGLNFTTHFKIYSKESYHNHAQWGNYRDIITNIETKHEHTQH